MDDNQIIDLYWSRQETAISETKKKYEKYLFSIANRILAHYEDAEESVNDTYLADLRRHGTALHSQIVHQRLPVIGNHKFRFCLLLGLLQQKFHQLFLGGFLGHTTDF